MRKQLRPYQHIALRHIAQRSRCALWAGMGMGKTVTVLSYIEAQQTFAGESFPTLVLAPKRVALDTWPNEVNQWAHLRSLKVQAAIGSASERAAALRADAGVVSINYDNLPWLIEHYAGRAWPFRRIVADESTRLKGFRLRQGGVRARSLAEIAHKDVGHWVNLTGTPSPNGLLDLWGQMWFIDAGERLGRTYHSYKNRWFRPENGSQFAKYVPVTGAQEQIQERLIDVCLTLRASDWFDLRAPVVNKITVDIGGSARAQYKKLQKELQIALEGSTVTAVNAAALSIKCLQLANGAAYLDAGGEPDDATPWRAVHDAKLEALESIVNEASGASVLVAYHFVSDKERILQRFPQAVHISEKNAVDRWNKGQIPILLAHPQSAGHGLNLQHGGNVLVFFSHWWSGEQHDQIVERIGPTRQAQSGYDRNVWVHYIIAKGTVDEAVMAKRESNSTVQEALLNFMKQSS